MKQNLHFQKKKISRLFFYENPTREKQINKTSSFIHIVPRASNLINTHDAVYRRSVAPHKLSIVPRGLVAIRRLTEGLYPFFSWNVLVGPPRS